jgi:hypothetical protein
MKSVTEAENSIEINDQSAFCTYLLTIRRARFEPAEAFDFRVYFRTLAAAGCEVLVVDGSPPEVFAEHAIAWRSVCRHEPVDAQYKYLNGKVNGIHTGVAVAAHDRIILADDDIRYTPEDACRMAELLEDYDMVRPQNYFRPLPVWARTEAARMLINRAWISEGDYSGTLGVTRNAMLRVGHYDGDVLFDNEEIVKHFRLKGARIKYARDFFILKLPPTFEKWVEQRPRQAYEDFVMRVKTLFFMATPIVLALTLLKSGGRLTLIYAAVISLGAVVSAARGLTDGAARFFPPRVVLYAPLWIAERCVSTYWAFYWYLMRGGYPFGDKIVSKGTGRAWSGAADVSEENNADATN